MPPCASSKRPMRFASRAGEGAALVAEQLGLDQRRRHRRAVEHDEALVRARRRQVDRLGQALLAGAGLAFEQDGQIGLRDALEHAEQLAHRRRAAEHVAEAIVARQRDRHLFAERLERERDLAGLDACARLRQVELAHAIAVDEGAVGRAEIAQQEAERRRLDLEVVARHGLVLQRAASCPLCCRRAGSCPRLRSAAPVAGDGAEALGVAHERPLVLGHRARLLRIVVCASSLELHPDLFELARLELDRTIARNQPQPRRRRFDVHRVPCRAAARSRRSASRARTARRCRRRPARRR